MIETQDSLFANLTDQLLWDLPEEPETRVVNLAAVAIGVFRSRSLQVGQVVARSPLEASRDTLKKRVQRFLKNAGVKVEVFQRPLAQRILGQIVAAGRLVLLILDRTEWDAFNRDSPDQTNFPIWDPLWDGEAINARRLELLLDNPSTHPHQEGVLIIDDSGDRKSGNNTDHVARQYLGSLGKIDNGIVAVTSLWADERLYFPLHALPYTPAGRLPGGRKDPDFRTKPQQGLDLVASARETDIPFRAVVADNFYGDNFTFQVGLEEAGLPYVLALRPNTGTWAPMEAAHTPREAAEDLDWDGPQAPGEWQPVVRRFRDGHEETWWAAELRLASYGPDQRVRLVAATTDPATLPENNTWYLITNLPRPGSDRVDQSPFRPADLGEIVRLYGLRIWVEQSYKQVKQELGWADFMVRRDWAIRRHWILVFCAFSFCWRAWFDSGDWEAPAPQRGEKPEGQASILAGNPPSGSQLADTLDHALALVASLVAGAPALGAPGTTELGGERSSLQPLSPVLTNYRYILAINTGSPTEEL